MAACVMQIGDRIEVLRDDGLPARIIFDGVRLAFAPADAFGDGRYGRGRSEARDLTYLTPGLGWAADYVALFDEANGPNGRAGLGDPAPTTAARPYVNAFDPAGRGLRGQAPNRYNNYGGYRPMPPPPPPVGLSGQVRKLPGASG
jgi:hypothetical protein